MKKTIIGTIIIAATLALGFSAQAGQPVINTLTVTNSISAATATTSPLTANILDGTLTSSGGSVQTNLDTVFQTQWTFYGTLAGTAAGTGTTNGAVTIGTQVSPDGSMWATGPSLYFPAFAPGATSVSLVTNLSSTTYRYVRFVQPTTTATNVYVTNSAVSLKTFWKTQ